MVIETMMIGVMIYQVTMPQINNGKYQLIYDGESIVRMNTQNGTMERCDKKLNCQPVKQGNKENEN